MAQKTPMPKPDATKARQIPLDLDPTAQHYNRTCQRELELAGSREFARKHADVLV
jgi:hypothetical protein